MFANLALARVIISSLDWPVLLTQEIPDSAVV